MNRKILKIDLDLKTREEAISLLMERMKYFKDIFGVEYTYWKKIELVKKTRYSARIFLKKDLLDDKNIIILQLIFGSDWRKEINTFYNSQALKMSYSNRMFDMKYYNKKFKYAEVEDITEELRFNLKYNVQVSNWIKFAVFKIRKWLH